MEKPRDRRYAATPPASPVTLVPLATSTWIADAPGTTVGAAVVAVLAVVVGGTDDDGLVCPEFAVAVVVVVVCAAALTPMGARVADGMRSAPTTTAATTTSAPRNQRPLGPKWSRGSCVSRSGGTLPPLPSAGSYGRRLTGGASPTRVELLLGRLETAPPAVALLAAQAAHDERRVLQGFAGVHQVVEPAVVRRRRHTETIADRARLGTGPRPPRLLQVENVAIGIGEFHPDKACQHRAREARILAPRRSRRVPSRCGRSRWRQSRHRQSQHVGVPAVALSARRCGAAGSADDL